MVDCVCDDQNKPFQKVGNEVTKFEITNEKQHATWMKSKAHRGDRTGIPGTMTAVPNIYIPNILG